MLSPDPICDPSELLRPVPGLILVDARPGLDAYTNERLAGAVHLDLDGDLSGDASNPAEGGRHPLPSLEQFGRTLAGRGITPDAAVVVYDALGGAKAAARAWWLLRAVGHERAWILDGGIQIAKALGVPVESGSAPPPLAASAYPVPSGWQLPTVTRQEVRERGGRLLLDVRTPARFRGEEDPFDPVPGHIPGASNAPLVQNLSENGRFRSPDELAELYRPMGAEVAPIVSCGSGVTACHTIAAFERAGLPRAALYVGSYSEWSRSGERVERGTQNA